MSSLGPGTDIIVYEIKSNAFNESLTDSWYKLKNDVRFIYIIVL